MPEFTNSLRQRLAANEKSAAQVHPDADMITAYVEESLPSTERETMVAHLAVCEPCREVVVLTQSLLAEPATQTVLTAAAIPRWRRLFTPAFGAAASVVAMAAIAFMVIQLPQKNLKQFSNGPTSRASAQETQQAKVTPIPDQTVPTEAKGAVQAQNSAPAQNLETRSASAAGKSQINAAKVGEIKREESARAKATPAPAAPVPAAPAGQPAKMAVLTGGLSKKDYVNTNFFTSSSADNVVLDSQSNNLPPAPQPQPGATNTGFNTASNKITMFADLPPNAAGKSNVRMLTPAPPPEHLGCTVCKFVQSTAHTLGFHSPVRTPALRAGALSSSALGGPGMFSGTIEKSQPVEISAAPERADTDSLAASGSLSAGAMAQSRRLTDSASPLWKIAEGKLMKSAGQSQWEDAYPVASSTVEFSFVNARGNDVWAGGSHAYMIHSRDGGSTWETVKLGDNASGTIVSIIAGTMSVQVKTSDNQTWSSADGGITWKLRGE